jgi:hypothetical protein
MKSNKWSRKNARKTKKNKGDTINTFDFNKNSVIKKTNKMNCSPMVDGKTPTKETCYTKDILMKIKAAYNEKRDTNDQITTDNPNVSARPPKLSARPATAPAALPTTLQLI